MAPSVSGRVLARQGTRPRPLLRRPCALSSTSSSVASRKAAVAVALCLVLLLVAALTLGSGGRGAPEEVGVSSGGDPAGPEGPSEGAPASEAAHAEDAGDDPAAPAEDDGGAPAGEAEDVDRPSSSTTAGPGKRVVAESASERRPATTARPRATTTTTKAKPRPTSTTRRPTTTTTRPKPTTTTKPRSTEQGEASWYDHQPGTCAHKTIPFGTVVTVTNLDNGRSTTCRVNDRGPYVAGRIIDLERADFQKVADLSDGVFPARITW